jgi:heme exporter protein B
MFTTVRELVKKEFLLEWRNKYALSGILLYLLCIIIIIFFTFETLQPAVWVVLFWVIILFTSVSAVARSFQSENAGKTLYLYTLVSPQSIILSKIIYNICVMLFLSMLAVLFYAFSAGFPVTDVVSFFLAILLGAISFASVFSMMSAISAKAGNSGTLMAILSFPVMLPILKILVRVSLNTVSNEAWSVNTQDILYLLALDILIITLALVLFPYLWRD